MFINNLKQACSDNETNITALLRKLNVSKENITSWNNGGIPSANLLTSIAEELGCSVDFLLGIDNIKTTTTQNNQERRKKIDYLINLIKDLPDDKLDAVITILFKER